MSAALRESAENETQEIRADRSRGTRRRMLKGMMVGAIVLALLVVTAVVGLPRLRGDFNAVVNGSAEVNAAGWQAASDGGEVGVQRFTLQDGPKGLHTAVDLRRAEGQGSWA